MTGFVLTSKVVGWLHPGNVGSDRKRCAMKQKYYFLATAVIFSIIAVLHLARIILDWSASIAGWSVPMWLSWVAIVVSVVIAYYGFTFSKRRR